MIQTRETKIVTKFEKGDVAVHKIVAAPIVVTYVRNGGNRWVPLGGGAELWDHTVEHGISDTPDEWAYLGNIYEPFQNSEV